MMRERVQEKCLDDQVIEHLNFLHGLGFIVTELVVGKWTKCAGEDSPKPSGSFCYVTRQHELRSGGLGLITVAKRHGEQFSHKTLPSLKKNPFFGPSSLPAKYVAASDDDKPQTNEDLRRLEFIWSKASMTGQSFYLNSKGLRPVDGLRFSVTEKYGNSLVIPLRDEHRVLRGIQFISDDGNKRIIGRLKGCGFRVPGTRSSIIVCEGIATGLFLRDVTGIETVCALSSGNLSPIAEALRKRAPNANILIAGDNDRHLTRNEGRLAAERTAALISGVLAIPDFGDIPPSKSATDWLDLATLCSRDVAMSQLKKLIDSMILNNTRG